MTIGTVTEIDKLLLEIDIQASKPMAVLDRLSVKFNKTFTSMNENIQQTQKLMLGIGLGLLFTGMAVKRFADIFMKSIVKTFMTIRGEGDYFNNQLLAMQASLEYVKYALFEAFAQSDLFAGLVEGVVNFSRWLGDIISKHPELSKFIIVFAGIASVLGGVAMIAGQATLAFSSFGVGIFPIIGAIILLAIALTALISIWTSNKFTTIGKIILSLGTAILVVLGLIVIFGESAAILKAVGMMFKWIGTGGVVALGLAIATVTVLIYGMMDALGGGWEGFFKFFVLVGAGIINVLTVIGLALFRYFVSPLTIALKAAIAIASALGKTGLADKLRGILISVNGMESKLQGGATDLVAKLEKNMGVDYIKQSTGIDSPEAMWNKLFNPEAGIMPTMPDSTKLSSDINEQKKIIEDNNKAIEELGGGASLADLKDLQEEQRDLLQDMKDNQRNSTPIAINVSGSTESEIYKYLDAYFKDNKDRLFGSTGGG